MSRTVRKGRINRHEKITQCLLSGDIIHPNDIREVFKGSDQEKVLYRLSTNIYNIRKDGGIVKVYKDGRNVVGYQLINPTEFDSTGRYVGPQVKVQVENQVKDEEITEVIDQVEVEVA